MSDKPMINRIEIHEFWHEVTELGVDYNGFNSVYEPGARREMTRFALKIGTTLGIDGILVGGGTAEMGELRMYANYLLGKNALEREKIYNDVKRALRKYDRMSMGLVDICLWDIAGKLYNAPIYELIGGWRTKLPSYASTYHGDQQPDGLSSPEAYADFAEQCLEMGYPAYKIHGWGDAPIRQEVATVLEVGRRVGDRMDLLIDPACEYNTFADAWKVGRACDEAGFMWLEDPFKDGGVSQYAHRKLRQMIKTPILQCEHVRGIEPKADFLIAEATDFMRVDPLYDGGITGGLKIAHIAEGFGVDAEVHAPGPAQRHLMAALRNSNYYEMALVHPKVPSINAVLYADGYDDGLDAVDANGCVDVPAGPGLGVTYDWDLIERNRRGLLVFE
ncbi:MAG: enolase C-terminal domain-like protein [Chloroflexota bacterium]